MNDMMIYEAETSKPVDCFVKDLRESGEKRGFIIHNENKMEMARLFGQHGIPVAEGFDLHMIQVCKPEKAAQSLSTNPERAPFMPKFIMTFTAKGKTQIRMLIFGAAVIDRFIGDKTFQESLASSYDSITEMIKEAK